MDKHQTIVVLDFGGQYNQLIARRVRDLGVYTELLPYSTSVEKMKEINPIGIILTGGPNSVFTKDALVCDKEIFNLGIPMLGICYGAQLLAFQTGGDVASATTKEYGKCEIEYSDCPLFEGINKTNICWMSHTDYVSKLGKGFEIVGKTAT